MPLGYHPDLVLNRLSPPLTPLLYLRNWSCGRLSAGYAPEFGVYSLPGHHTGVWSAAQHSNHNMTSDKSIVWGLRIYLKNQVNYNLFSTANRYISIFSAGSTLHIFPAVPIPMPTTALFILVSRAVRNSVQQDLVFIVNGGSSSVSTGDAAVPRQHQLCRPALPRRNLPPPGPVQTIY